MEVSKLYTYIIFSSFFWGGGVLRPLNIFLPRCRLKLFTRCGRWYRGFRRYRTTGRAASEQIYTRKTQTLLRGILKRQFHEFFTSTLLHETHSPRPLIETLV